MTCDVLIFVEDPGAANFFLDVPSALTGRSLEVHLAAAGPAVSYLGRFDVSISSIDDSDANELLDRVQPKVLVIGTGENRDTLGLSLVQAGRERGTPTVAAIDSPASISHRLSGRSGDPLCFAPDWLLVPDAWTQEAYLDVGYPRSRVIVTGHPHYDRIRAEGARLVTADREALRHLLFPRRPEDRPVLVFATERSTGLDPAEYRRSSDYRLQGRGKAIRRTEVVLEEFLDALALVESRAYTVLRLHPKNSEADFEPYLDDFDQVSQHEPALDLLYASDGVVGMTTMLLEEAVVLGTPALSIVPRSEEREWLIATRLGLVPCATTRREVRSEIDLLMRHPTMPSKAAVDAAFPPGSIDVVAGVLATLVEGHGA